MKIISDFVTNSSESDYYDEFEWYDTDHFIALKLKINSEKEHFNFIETYDFENDTFEELNDTANSIMNFIAYFETRSSDHFGNTILFDADSFSNSSDNFESSGGQLGSFYPFPKEKDEANPYNDSIITDFLEKFFPFINSQFKDAYESYHDSEYDYDETFYSSEQDYYNIKLFAYFFQNPVHLKMFENFLRDRLEDKTITLTSIFIEQAKNDYCESIVNYSKMSSDEKQNEKICPVLYDEGLVKKILKKYGVYGKLGYFAMQFCYINKIIEAKINQKTFTIKAETIDGRELIFNEKNCGTKQNANELLLACVLICDAMPSYHGKAETILDIIDGNKK